MLSEKITERMLESIPMEEVYGRTKAAGRTVKGFTSLSTTEEKARQVEPGRHWRMRTQGVSLVSAAPQPHPAQCLMQNRHLVHVCLLYETWRRWFSCSYDKEEPPRHWRGRQRALATLYDKKGNKTPLQPPKSKQKLWKKQKVRSSRPVSLHPSLCTVCSVLTLGIACKIIHE